ncbi:MAG: GspE/PulE family protein [Chthoniobacterales bacterium]
MTSALLQLLPEKIARQYCIFPLEADDSSVTVASAHPLGPEALESLRFRLDRTIHQRLFSKEAIEAFLEKYYSPPPESIFCNTIAVPSEEGPFLTSRDQENPVIRYVKMLLDEAIEQDASDVHLESFETECRIRYRIDGLLLEKKSVSLSLATPLISRLKLLAHLDITERRLPQDGRLTHTWNKITVDFRLSSLPTQFGESLVLRVLDRRKMIRHLSSLELPSTLERSLHQLLQKPHGLFLVTGPTGAGKTTTLYACLQELQARHLKLITAEDPVEYEIEGIMQVAIQESIGRTFANVLRSFLRHDPDVIMIGETRDEETARMAMQASLTGHLVLTTLHTNDAPGAISRLIDMGLDPLMITTTLEGILAQRLVRKICSFCRTAYPPEKFSSAELAFFNTHLLPSQLYSGVGCEQCHHTGYQGRIGIFELLLLDDELRLLIHERAACHRLREKAAQQGMSSLHSEARRSVLEGVTTVEEVKRAM